MEDCSTDERLRQETLCHRQWTDEYVEHPETLMRQNVVIVWIQCLPVDVFRHAYHPCLHAIQANDSVVIQGVFHTLPKGVFTLPTFVPHPGFLS